MAQGRQRRLTNSEVLKRIISRKRSPAGVGAARNRFAGRMRIRYLINAMRYAGGAVSNDVAKLVLSCCRPARRKEIIARARAISDSNGGHERSRAAPVDVDESLETLMMDRAVRDLIYRDVLPLLVEMHARLSAKPGVTVVERRLETLADTFGLSGPEIEVLALCFLYATDGGAEKVYDELCTFMQEKTRYLEVSTQVRLVSILTGLTRGEVSRAIAADATLMKTGLLDSSGTPANEVQLYLQGQSRKPFADSYFTEVSGGVIGLSDHTLDPIHLQTLRTLIEARRPGQGMNILLYGPPGTGKTELARSLGRHFSLRTYEIRTVDDREDKAQDANRFRQRALTVCRRLVGNEDALVIVDEADAMLNAVPELFAPAPQSEKGQINRLLDDIRTITVWITNRSDGIDESTCRRFDYSIRFERLSGEQRLRIWRNCIARYRIKRAFTDSFVADLADRFEVGAGGIDIAVRNAARACRATGDTRVVPELVRTLLTAHLRVVTRRDVTIRTSDPSTSSYALEGLHVKGRLDDTFEILGRFNEQWRAGSDGYEVRGMNVLLFGPPGTGKTEFAKYLARRLRRRLHVKRGSDLLNPFVGMTEQHIRDAFERAERDQAVLLLDEADGMLGSREGAVRSWEMTQVNELLTAMETFRGILICSTNFRAGLDTASIRRFALKLEFDYLLPDGVVAFYQRLLAPLATDRLTEEHAKTLRGLRQLAPGDFKVVRQQHVLRDRKKVRHGALIEGLRRETAAKNGGRGRVIGFAKG